MNELFKLLLLTLFSVILIAFYSCKKDEPIPDENPSEKSGKLIFKFNHVIDGQNIDYDTIKYVNEAGNKYGVNVIQYFVTDVTLHKSGGTSMMIDDWTDFAYVDTDIPTTLTWEVFDPIPIGNYDSITFTLGFNEVKNQSFMFVNPPEVNMVWPVYLGGGYHYLKINTKWIDTTGLARGCAWHLGIGQTYDSSGIVNGFIQNYFTVGLPNSSFEITENNTKEIQIVMNVENWFKNPNTYNFDDFGGDIMQTQAAMILGCENGHDVFTIGYIQ